MESRAKRQSTIDRRRTLFEEAAAIIKRDYSQNLSLDALAHGIAASRRQLQRAFAEVGGTSFRAYLASVRMARAAELLAEGALQVHQVAAAVGYRQPAQFAKAFRRHHGAPPSSFRTRRDSLSARAA